MKLGLDVHGVIDTVPSLFEQLAKNRIKNGDEVHIITGQERAVVEPLVKNLGVPFTHFFSVVDYHHEIDTDMWQDDKGTWWMALETWTRTKGDYCTREGIDLMIDNSLEYAGYMPDTCTFVYTPKNAYWDFILDLW